MAITVYINPFAHQSSGGGGFGGTTYNIFTLTNCSTGGSVTATDPSSFAPSVGDVVAVTPSGGSAVCATVASSGTSSTDPATTITATFSSCGNCNATNFCHVPSDFSMSLSGGSYSGSGYHNTVQVAASGSLAAVNIETKLTLESKLGGRAASDVVLSSFGQVTGLSISSGSISFTYDGSSCFNSATENLEYRLKVECGDNSTGSWVTHSTSYSSWSSTSVDHATASQQCSGGTLFQVTDCFDSSTHLVEDSSSYGVGSGDLVDFYDSSSTQRCGTITATNQGGSANGAYINWHGYSSCQNCANNNSITNPQLYTVTDCNNPSTTYVVDDTASSLFPSTGDVVDVYLNSGSYICTTVTGTTTGTAVGSIQSTYSTCVNCLISNGLQQHLVTDCNSSATHIVHDSSGMVSSVGDVISYYDKATSSTYYCGTVTTMNVTGTALYEYSSGYNDCTECNSNEGL